MKLKSIRIKNFKSYSDSYFEFKNGLDLIVGKNGEGKTSLQESLFYALFGKPFTKIKLSSLINSINGKKLEVQVEFEKNNKNYKVIRGMKPNIFEIYENGKKIEEHANIKDYQEFFETKILKFNELVYKQLVSIVANLSSSKNFVDLSSKEKENLLENVLDVSLFNYLNKIMKDELKYFNNKILSIENEISTNSILLDSEKDKIKQLKEKEKKFLETKNDQIKYFGEQIKILEKENERLKETLIKNKNIKNKLIGTKDLYFLINKGLKYLNNQKNEIISELKYIAKGKNDYYICKKCNTKNYISINENKLKNEDNLKEDYKNINKKIENETKKLEDVKKILDSIQKDVFELKQMKEKIGENHNKIIHFKNKIKEINNFVPEKIDESKIEIFEEKITKLKKDKEEIIKEKNNYEKLAQLIFKSNIKEKLIKQQIKDLNLFIEYFLNKFGLDYKIVIEENLKVQVQALHKSSEFYSLSNGEKARVNFALLFAFLKLIEEKNGIKLNVLFLDEALDSSLDYEGKEKLLEILTEFAETKDIIIISHSQDIIEKEIFKRIFEIKKDKFSKITQIF